MTSSPDMLEIEMLNVSAFAPFGDVIETRDSVKHFPINGGNTERFHDLMNIELDQLGHAIVSIFRGLPRELPFEIKMMERHPLGSQSFMPLNGRPYLVAVAPAGESLNIKGIRIFLASGNQGVNYRRGIWHHPLLALGETSDFLVIDRAGAGENCEERYFETSAWIPAVGVADVASPPISAI
jgi:ureidoglycolate lyase